MSVATPVVQTWDGENRLIYLKQGVTEFHWLEDIYTEYRNERRLNEDFRKWNPLLQASGNIAKGLGKATPRLLTLLEGTKVVPFDELTEIQVLGEAITDNADVDASLFDISSLTNAVVIQYQPPSAEVIVVDAIQKRLDYNGYLHYDPTSIYNGQLHPVGTDAEPVNNINDLLALSQEYNLTKVKIRNGNFIAPQDLQGWVFDGDGGRPVIDANGFNLSKSRINSAVIEGDWSNTTATTRFTDCSLQGTNMSGQFRECLLTNFISLKEGTSNFVDCYSGVVGDLKPIISFNNKAVKGRMSSYSGGIEIQDSTHPDTEFSIDSETTSITVGATNTDGEIVIRGTFDLDESNNNGTTIIQKIPVSGASITQQDKNDITNSVAEAINNPIIIDPLEKFNAVEDYLKRKYIDFNLSYNIVLNQNHLDTLESELSKDNLTVLYTSKVRLNIEIDNSIQNFDFRVYGLNTK